MYAHKYMNIDVKKMFNLLLTLLLKCTCYFKENRQYYHLSHIGQKAEKTKNCWRNITVCHRSGQVMVDYY